MIKMKTPFTEGIKTKKYLEFLLDSAPYAVVSTDLEGRIISFNKAAEEMYGYGENEVLGKHASLLQPEGIPNLLNKEIYESMTKGDGWQGEILNKRKNGEVFHVYLRTQKTMDENGRHIGLLSFATDISDRKKVTEEFGRLKELSGSIIEHAPIGIFTLDHEWKVSSVNPALLRIIGGNKPADVVGLNFRETPMYKALGGKILEEKLKKYGEMDLKKVQYNSLFAKKVFVDVSVTALRTDGRTVGSLFLLRDIEEQARLEEELKNRARELEDSNKMKELFIDIIRHDLINPLGIIKNFSEMLAEEERNEEKRKELIAIKNNARRTMEMIEDVKTFAKVERSTGGTYTVVNLTNVIANLIEQFIPYLEDKSMGIDFKSSGECPVKANPFIDDIFSNIMSNAIKYSPEESKIDVVIKDAGDFWRAQIKDRGPGIPDAEKLAIFERFKRIKRGSIKGTGLGLAIVKRVVEMHRGKVWVEDNPGGGSIFNVELPKAEGV